MRLEQINAQTRSIQLIGEINTRHLMQRGHIANSHIYRYVRVRRNEIIQFDRGIHQSHTGGNDTRTEYILRVDIILDTQDIQIYLGFRVFV